MRHALRLLQEWHCRSRGRVSSWFMVDAIRKFYSRQLSRERAEYKEWQKNMNETIKVLMAQSDEQHRRVTGISQEPHQRDKEKFMVLDYTEKIKLLRSLLNEQMLDDYHAGPWGVLYEDTRNSLFPEPKHCHFFYQQRRNYFICPNQSNRKSRSEPWLRGMQSFCSSLL